MKYLREGFNKNGGEMDLTILAGWLESVGAAKIHPQKDLLKLLKTTLKSKQKQIGKEHKTDSL